MESPCHSFCNIQPFGPGIASRNMCNVVHHSYSCSIGWIWEFVSVCRSDPCSPFISLSNSLLFVLIVSKHSHISSCQSANHAVSSAYIMFFQVDSTHGYSVVVAYSPKYGLCRSLYRLLGCTAHPSLTSCCICTSFENVSLTIIHPYQKLEQYQMCCIMKQNRHTDKKYLRQLQLRTSKVVATI